MPPQAPLGSSLVKRRSGHPRQAVRHEVKEFLQQEGRHGATPPRPPAGSFAFPCPRTPPRTAGELLGRRLKSSRMSLLAQSVGADPFVKVSCEADSKVPLTARQAAYGTGLGQVKGLVNDMITRLTNEDRVAGEQAPVESAKKVALAQAEADAKNEGFCKKEITSAPFWRRDVDLVLLQQADTRFSGGCQQLVLLQQPDTGLSKGCCSCNYSCSNLIPG